jgi:hypothetical protein
LRMPAACCSASNSCLSGFGHVLDVGNGAAAAVRVVSVVSCSRHQKRIRFSAQ